MTDSREGWTCNYSEAAFSGRSLSAAQDIAATPAGATPITYHVTRAIGDLDRLFTYARGESLTDAQMATLTAKKSLDPSRFSAQQLAANFAAAVDRVLAEPAAT